MCKRFGHLPRQQRFASYWPMWTTNGERKVEVCKRCEGMIDVGPHQRPAERQEVLK